MTLKDLLKKKDKVKEKQDPRELEEPPSLTILRSDTHTQEIINPPTFASDAQEPISTEKGGIAISKRQSRFRSLSNSSRDSQTERRPSGERRLSSLLHLRSSSHGSKNSANVPADLPDIDDRREGDDKEAQWENRATILANSGVLTPRSQSFQGNNPATPQSARPAHNNDDIQEAIRLHEAGDLVNSTAMFGRLADRDGDNNALSQVLYGLALRHGWGIAEDLPLAVSYLSRAASNSAAVESQALASGMKKGGTAKGELVLAIHELGVCYENGWGAPKDLVAARTFFETAANLGDTDSMVEAARCYENGVGGSKDKSKAAKYYRLAEQNGNKILGNSWIWKDKYDPK